MSRLPTTDLYFAHACASAIARWWRRGPIRALGANCFVAGDTMVLLRRDTASIMRAALGWHGRLAYVVDDDIAGAARSPSLPADYRRRLAAFDTAWHQPLLARAEVLLAASDPLAARLAGQSGLTRDIRRIEPCWPGGFADQAHFAPLAHGAPLHIAHLGTSSHAAALERLAPALAEVLAAHPLAHLTYIAPGFGPAPLARLANATRVEPMAWPAYRRWLGRRRFHLALYPLLDEPFDRARSANKLAEHAWAGAVGVYPQGWAPARAMGEAVFLAPPAPEDWGAALADILARPQRLAGMAQAAAGELYSRRSRGNQQSIWAEVLGVPVA